MEQHQQLQNTKAFKYKLDFYYQQAILYLVTLLFYAGVRGTFDFEQLPTLMGDPLLYIIIVFVLISIVSLILNKIRDRKLLLREKSVVFHQRSREREILFTDIEWMYIGRERSVKTAGKFQVIVFKIKDRRRLFRIRIGRYEHERELLIEMQRIAETVPKAKRPLFGLHLQ